MQKECANKLKWTISLTAILLILGHLIWPELKIDAIILGLVVVAVFPWVSSLLESVKLPGGWDFKFRDLDKAMRETIREATATIEQLRSVAITTAKATLTGLMADNFMDGTTLSTRLDLHDQIINTLRDIGVPEDHLSEADEMWKKGIGVIYHRGIRHRLEGRTQKSVLNSQASEEVLRASREFQGMLRFEDWQAPSPDQMEAFIKSKGLMTPELAECISDYRYFLSDGKIRRRDLFVQF